MRCGEVAQKRGQESEKKTDGTSTISLGGPTWEDRYVQSNRVRQNSEREREGGSVCRLNVYYFILVPVDEK